MRENRDSWALMESLFPQEHEQKAEARKKRQQRAKHIAVRKIFV